MTYFYSPHLHYSGNQFEQIIRNFETEGILVGEGSRNVLKYFNVNGTNINFKSFKEPNLLNKIVYRHFRKSKAKRSYENAQHLISRGLPTPEPVAYLEYFDMMGLDASYYISRQLENVVELRDVIARPDYPEREMILQKYTAYFFRMHEYGIEFLDNSPGNSLVEKKGDTYTIYLVDLNRMRLGQKMNIQRRMKNFARLTRDEKVMKIIAHHYARLANQPADLLYHYLISASANFWKARSRKKILKKKWKAFKKMIAVSLGWSASMHEPCLANFL